MKTMQRMLILMLVTVPAIGIHQRSRRDWEGERRWLISGFRTTGNVQYTVYPVAGVDNEESNQFV